MTIVETLPDRPLQESEVDSLDDSDRIVGNFPVYLEEVSQFAIGLVLVIDATAHVLSYDVEGDGWELIAKRDLDNPVEGGVHPDDMDTIKQLQSAASQHAGGSA